VRKWFGGIVTRRPRANHRTIHGPAFQECLVPIQSFGSTHPLAYLFRLPFDRARGRGAAIDGKHEPGNHRRRFADQKHDGAKPAHAAFQCGGIGSFVIT